MKQDKNPLMNKSEDYMKKWFKKLFPPIFFDFLGRVRCNSGREAYYPFDQFMMNRKAELIFDIGANVGDVSISAYKTFPEAKIFSFEPVLSTYKILNKNITNYRDRITPFQLGFFNVSQKIPIHVTTFHGANSIIQQSDDHRSVHAHLNLEEIGFEEIEVVTLDYFVKSMNISKIDIVKIDVEGVEKEVILGGIESFKNKIDTVFIELSLIRRGKQSTYWIEICQLLYDLGFVLSNIYDVARYLENDAEYIAQFDAVFKKNKF